VALNDSIVVLAAIRADPRAAAGEREAIVEATMGSTRHVLATTATTIGGFLPLLIFVGGDFWPSLAIVLVGGIAGSTIVALLFIPATYIIATEFNRRVHDTAPTSRPKAAFA
jgi:multidrug efflux pump subunit AcrB